MSKSTLEKLAAAVEQLHAQVAALTQRIQSMEAAGAAGVPGHAPFPEVPDLPSTDAAAPVQTSGEPISEEVLLALSAAVAAYLGARAQIRAVRLIGSTRWSQEGRVSIQASHHLNRG